MKRITISRLLSDRIEELMSDMGAHDRTVGPKHDPYAASEVVIDVRSLLGRFLTKKGMVDRSLCTDFGRFFTIINVNLEKRCGQPRLRLMSVSI